MSALTTLLTSQPYTVRGDSMMPSFRPGDLLLVSGRASTRSAPARGDVVVVRDPRDAGNELLKRIVGMPGDEVGLSDGLLFLNGEHVEEPYLGGLPSSPGLVPGNWRLGDAEFFILGDQRTRSTDSRQFGAIPRELIVGRAWCRIWPPRGWRLL